MPKTTPFLTIYIYICIFRFRVSHFQVSNFHNFIYKQNRRSSPRLLQSPYSTAALLHSPAVRIPNFSGHLRVLSPPCSIVQWTRRPAPFGVRTSPTISASRLHRRYTISFSILSLCAIFICFRVLMCLRLLIYF